MQNVEIEIQVQVENIELLKEFLKHNGKFVAERRQLDEYFTPAHKNFTDSRPIDEWLRLRDSGGTYSINYKNWHHNEKGISFHCDEYETKIDNHDTLRKILTVLGFKSLVVVDKVRNIWLYKNYEIAIDEVKGLGEFVEVEYKGEEEVEDKEKLAKEMLDWLKSLGCGKLIMNHVGYPFLLLFPNEGRNEEYK